MAQVSSMKLHLQTVYLDISFSSSSLCCFHLLVVAHSPLQGFVGSSICCWMALQEVWGLSGFCAVLYGRSHEAKSVVKRSKLKGLREHSRPLKCEMCYPTFCFHEWPNVASAYRYFHANWGQPWSFHFCELQTQKKQEFWVWHFTTSDSVLKTYFLNSKPKECIQLDELVNNPRHCCCSIWEEPHLLDLRTDDTSHYLTLDLLLI